jgi:7-carboxy-7-deazaguanine synthase (Cx14CxxC type)
MTYSVKEMFYTLQGEGAQAGRPAVFCRFAGCNLWSGREEDRAKAVCQFCDTAFVGTDGTDGGKYTSAEALADRVASLWPVPSGRRFVVLTGGEPMLQVNPPLLEALHARDFEIAIETNGTLDVPAAVDWICVSPKAGTTLRQVTGHELKVVVPQQGQDLDALVELAFDLHLLQPMDGPLRRENTQRAIEVCLRDPRWRLSTQTHKALGIR